MGTTANQYLMVGVKLPYRSCKLGDEDKFEPFYDETYKEAINHHDGLCVISDGMDGKYTFIGRVLEKAINDYWINGPIDCERAGGIYNSPAGKEMLAALITKTFPELELLVEPCDIGVWFFTHYH